MNIIPPIHPAEILREEFLKPLDVSAQQLAHDIAIEEAVIQQLLAERISINAEIALKLSRYFDTSAKLWLNLQGHYDLQIAEVKLAAILPTISPRVQPSVRIA